MKCGAALVVIPSALNAYTDGPRATPGMPTSVQSVELLWPLSKQTATLILTLMLPTIIQEPSSGGSVASIWVLLRRQTGQHGELKTLLLALERTTDLDKMPCPLGTSRVKMLLVALLLVELRVADLDITLPCRRVNDTCMLPRMSLFRNRSSWMGRSLSPLVGITPFTTEFVRTESTFPGQWWEETKGDLLVLPVTPDYIPFMETPWRDKSRRLNQSRRTRRSLLE
jgi:hypothetical protein